MKHLLCFLLAFNVAQAEELGLKEYLELPANPMKINITLGKESVSKKITALTGGTLTLSAENGDMFELVIPPKSLQRDTEITLQKVKDVKHPKLSTTARYSSVEISPDGTQLQIPATMTFKPKLAYAIQTLTPFSAQADGDETHLTTLVGKPTPNAIKIELSHFSSYTISDQASAEEIIDQGLSKMESTRVSNWIARKILENKRNGNGEMSQTMEKAFRDSFNNVVLPSILRVNTCASGKNALENFLAWRRGVEISGREADGFYPPDFNGDMASMIKDVSDQCYEIAKNACYVDHRPIETIRYALEFMKMSTLLGIPEISEKFDTLAIKCSRFKFFMESEIWVGETREDSNGVTALAEFDFTLPLYTDQPIEGTINVVDTYLNITDFECSITSNQTKPGKVLIKNFLSSIDKDEKDFMVSIGNLTPFSFSQFHCVDKSTDPPTVIDLNIPFTPMGTWWGGLFMGAHGPTGLNELDMKTGYYNIKNWQVRNDTRFAAKEYAQTIAEGSLNETTSIIIYHIPEPL